ncbi:MAG TPA: DEAD/DEAH box helicase [Burkholderiales bacterium]|nr:DEAD/DEAH box helicase [Burkholderiales bacterium]
MRVAAGIGLLYLQLMRPTSQFHPAVAAWFDRSFAAPTAAQAQAWPAIAAGRHVLIAAPTGSGKTLAAFLAAIDGLVRQGVAGELKDETQVVYVSPLKALSNDIKRNLEVPLAGIRETLREQGLPEVDIRAWVRTGDTTSGERERMRRRPPHIVVTTPESLYILLGSESGRAMLATTRAVIVDEIHALAPNKRGTHLAISLERLDALCGRRLPRIGLSATQKPIEAIARFLVGEHEPCTIIDTGHRRARDLALELPESPLEAVMSAEVWEQVYRRLAELTEAHRTTLIFVNTRRMAERVTRHLSDRLGEDHVTAHHGSLAKEARFDAEQRLKHGQLKALVATASLELGIDIGDVDLACQLGSPRSIASFLQRVGRSGHAVDGMPKGRLFPLSRDELVECAALLDAVRRGELDQVAIPERPLDVLAQQIVAEVAAREWNEDELYALMRRAWPYRALPRADFAAVVAMLAEGFATRRGRRSALVHHDAVNQVLRGRRGARMTAITSGGTIPDNADYAVLLEPENQIIGSVNEDFAVESLAGDIFQLGNNSYRIIRVERGTVRVEDAHGQPPTIPFWLGEAPGRSAELSAAVSRLREEVAARLRQDPSGEAARGWLEAEVGLSPEAAAQLIEYLAAGNAALGCLPTLDTIVLERFFDAVGGMQLVIHSPYGSRVNRAWGLALRKRFCRKFNFELQAAATEDNIVLSLTTAHSFELSEVARYLNAASVREVLIQAMLDAPMFITRWRWVAGVSLALPRFRGGRKVPPQLARMDAEDLIGATFPDQIACAENLVGEREIPDHPLVRQTIHDCLTEAMDIDGLEALIARIEQGAVRVVARDLTEPSPLALEVLSARPYAYLDDAPLEERRTQAVMSRRWLAPEDAAELGRLDPEAIERVQQEAWPEAANADELHDALLWLGVLSETEADAGSGWRDWLAALARDRRVARLQTPGGSFWITAERLPQVQALWSDAPIDPAITAPAAHAEKIWSREEALVELVRGRLEGQGPVTQSALADLFGLPSSELAAALAALEVEGFAFRGRFLAVDEDQWCERRLLARIHRYTIKRLRAEIEPVAARDFLRFLLTWQRVAADARMEGPEAIEPVIEQLEGFAAPAAAWESEILPARLAGYDPDWLDDRCVAGRVTWRRLTARNGYGNGERRPAPVRSTPIALLARRNAHYWGGRAPADEVPLSPRAQLVAESIRAQGASFFDEMIGATGLLPSQLEEALTELVALGVVNSDSFAGLRALLVPSSERRPGPNGRRRRRTVKFGMEDAGRWALARPGRASIDPARPDPESVEHVARTLLARYGVVFWRLLEREADWVPPWRDLLRVYRRLEARGDIRGGRFVAGFSGEQFALPEAIGMLRDVRRKQTSGALVSLSGADPLNLVGILTPGARLAALTGNRVLYRDGIPIATLAAGEVRFLETLDAASEWEAHKTLLRQTAPRRPVAEDVAEQTNTEAPELIGIK